MLRARPIQAGALATVAAAALLLGSRATDGEALAAAEKRQMPLKPQVREEIAPQVVGGPGEARVTILTAPVEQTIVMNGGSAGHGLGIRGTFTASPPLCPAGRFEDGTGTPVGLRIRVSRFASCDDGSGTVEFEYFGVRENTDGPGTWRVLDATGRLAAFRGFGTTSNDSIEHDPTTGSGRFVNTWTGRSDLDSTPPSARIEAATARPVGRRVLVRVGFRAADDKPANPVVFSLTVRMLTAWNGGSRAVTRAGDLLNGRGAVALSVRNPSRARALRVELVVRDPLRNERTITRVIRIRLARR